MTVTNSGSINTNIINISSGSGALSPLPLNQYTSVYFRVKNICSGSGNSSYSNILESVCEETPPPSVYSFYFSSPGRPSYSESCGATTFDNIWYTDTNVLDIGVQVYLSSDLSSPVGSGNLWYQEGIDGISYRIDNDGIIAEE